MKAVNKVITLDGYEYQVQFKPEPATLAPCGFSLVVVLDENTVLKNKYNNYEQKPFKEAIEEILKYHHEKIIEKVNRNQKASAMLEEFNQWDGVIQ
jgi:hypothetical protein